MSDTPKYTQIQYSEVVKRQSPWPEDKILMQTPPIMDMEGRLHKEMLSTITNIPEAEVSLPKGRDRSTSYESIIGDMVELANKVSAEMWAGFIREKTNIEPGTPCMVLMHPGDWEILKDSMGKIPATPSDSGLKHELKKLGVSMMIHESCKPGQIMVKRTGVKLKFTL